MKSNILEYLGKVHGITVGDNEKNIFFFHFKALTWDCFAMKWKIYLQAGAGIDTCGGDAVNDTLVSFVLLRYHCLPISRVLFPRNVSIDTLILRTEIRRTNWMVICSEVTRAVYFHNKLPLSRAGRYRPESYSSRWFGESILRKIRLMNTRHNSLRFP